MSGTRYLYLVSFHQTLIWPVGRDPTRMSRRPTTICSRKCRGRRRVPDCPMPIWWGDGRRRRSLGSRYRNRGRIRIFSLGARVWDRIVCECDELRGWQPPELDRVRLCDYKRKVRAKVCSIFIRVCDLLFIFPSHTLRNHHHLSRSSCHPTRFVTPPKLEQGGIVDILINIADLAAP